MSELTISTTAIINMFLLSYKVQQTDSELLIIEASQLLTLSHMFVSYDRVTE